MWVELAHVGEGVVKNKPLFTIGGKIINGNSILTS